MTSAFGYLTSFFIATLLVFTQAPGETWTELCRFRSADDTEKEGASLPYLI